MEDFVELLLGDDYNANMQLPDPYLVQYFNDLENRIIWIDSEIKESTLDVVSRIINWNRQDKNIPIENRAPIKIYFNSIGGSLDIEETIVSVIRLSKTPVYGYALGIVASAASLIYLSCHKRYALPNAYFVFHQGSCSNISGDYAAVQASMEDYRRQVEKMEKFYIENTDYPEETIKEKIKTDWYIHFDEALAHHIITDPIEDIEVLL